MVAGMKRNEDDTDPATGDHGLPVIAVRGLSKDFVLHNQGGVRIAVLRDVAITVRAGECVALAGASGSGKSTLMRMIWGNYLAASGSIRVAGVELVGADPRTVRTLRAGPLGYVSQFLRVLPRVPAVDIVAEPLLDLGVAQAEARARARRMLARVAIPERLWELSPTTFSGGEQQRVNLARGFIRPRAVLLLDEPTASLDAGNRETVLALIAEAKAAGSAILGIFHDAGARRRICDRTITMDGPFRGDAAPGAGRGSAAPASAPPAGSAAGPSPRTGGG